MKIHKVIGIEMWWFMNMSQSFNEGIQGLFLKIDNVTWSKMQNWSLLLNTSQVNQTVINLVCGGISCEREFIRGTTEPLISPRRTKVHSYVEGIKKYGKKLTSNWFGEVDGSFTLGKNKKHHNTICRIGMFQAEKHGKIEHRLLLINHGRELVC